MTERIFSSEPGDDEVKQETKFRPENFREYIGQQKVVDNVSLMVESAKIRKSSRRFGNGKCCQRSILSCR